MAQVVVLDGEAYKNWETLNLIFEESDCAASKTTLIALGGGVGGVIGEMTGFAAACPSCHYLRKQVNSDSAGDSAKRGSRLKVMAATDYLLNSLELSL